MASGTIATVASVGGVTVSATITKTGDHPNVYGDSINNIPLPAGKSVSSWVKTDADTAAGDLASGHGYSNGKHDFFWTTAGVAKARYDVDVTFTNDTMAIDSGTGDAFPDTAVTDVICTEVVQINTAIDGDAVKMLVLNATCVASVYFEDTDDAEVAQFDLAADAPYTWHDTSGVTNPVTGNPITVCFASNGSTTAGILTILSLEDSTP